MLSHFRCVIVTIGTTVILYACCLLGEKGWDINKEQMFAKSFLSVCLEKAEAKEAFPICIATGAFYHPLICV